MPSSVSLPSLSLHLFSAFVSLSLSAGYPVGALRIVAVFISREAKMRRTKERARAAVSAPHRRRGEFETSPRQTEREYFMRVGRHEGGKGMRRTMGIHPPPWSAHATLALSNEMEESEVEICICLRKQKKRRPNRCRNEESGEKQCNYWLVGVAYLPE